MIVLGEGPAVCPLMLVGDAPGENEDRVGRPFIGKSGEELDGYLRAVGLNRRQAYITNVVKVAPRTATGKLRSPTVAEVEQWLPTLADEIADVGPRVIAALGAFATRVFLGPDVDMHTVHGIGWRVELDTNRGDWTTWAGVVVPCFHPAAGLRAHKTMAMIAEDVRCVRRVMDGGEAIRTYSGLTEMGDYTEGFPLHLLDGSDRERWPVVALDTETAGFTGKPWCLSLSWTPGSAAVVMADDVAGLAAVNRFLKGRLAVLHNAKFDLRVLAAMGIIVETCTDTMVMAYLLGTEPQGLKALAARHCGMKMRSYEEVVGAARAEVARRYLEVVDRCFLDEVYHIRGKSGKLLANPKRTSLLPAKKRNTRSLLSAIYAADDPYAKWQGSALCSKGAVEQYWGVMPEATLADAPRDEAIFYSARDADATLQVYHILWPRIAAEGLEDTLARDLRIVPMIIDMEDEGIEIDVGRLETLGEERIRPRMAELEQEMAEMSPMGGFNPASPKQTAEVLFTLGLIEDEGGSTAADELDKIEDSHPIVPLLKEWRELGTLMSKYVDALQGKTGAEARIHTTFRLTGTDTGRLSSSNPNLTNIPSRTSLGKEIRYCFVPADEHVFLSIDLSQIEPRVLAHDSRDPELLRIFLGDRDYHTETAAKIYGVRLEDVTKEMRSGMKPVGIGVSYGMTEHGLSRNTGLSLDEARRLLDEWYRVYPGVLEYHKRLRAEAKATGRVRDMFGRYRLTPGVNSALRYVREKAIRECINAPIQSGAAGILKQAMGDMIPVYRRYMSEGVYCWPLIPIHDEVLAEVDEGRAEEIGAVLGEIMANAVKLVVPIKVDVEVGTSWGEVG